MDQTGWLWVLSGTCSLLTAFGGFVVKRVIHEIDRQRLKTEELFDIMAALRVEAAQAKADNGKEFVTKTDFIQFESKIFKQLDKTDEKLDQVLLEMHKRKEGR